MFTRHFEHWPPGKPKTLEVPRTTVVHNLEDVAARTPQSIAIDYYGSRMTYAELLREVEALAGYLQQRCGVSKGDRVLLSRAITMIESNLESDKLIAKEIVQAILPKSGNSFRIGITGVPGVGKSTFIEVFGLYLIKQGFKVAILSIDPIFLTAFRIVGKLVSIPPGHLSVT